MILDKCWCETRDGNEFLLHVSAPRSVADGGEHMHWWMLRAYLAADNVASTLAAMAMVGRQLGVYVRLRQQVGLLLGRQSI